MEVLAYVVYITAQNREEAEKIGRHLVKEKVAACVNIVDNIKSLFWWEKNMDEANECLLIAKTSVEKFKKLEETVKKVHSYQVPEIIALPVVAGSKDYLDWIKSSVK
jgi:periplasmic divalent cation tolerance protein